MADSTEAPERTSPSDAALARYTTRMRRQRGVYAAVLGVIVVALGVVVGVAWSRGEVANTSLHTVGSAPPSLAVTAASPHLGTAWRTSDQAAIGVPQWGGTVVTFSAHTVRGRDARTGKSTWSYSRSNRTVCTAAQAGGTTVAIYEVDGNCDEVTGLDSGTGDRKWTRTLDMDGMSLLGHPTYQVLPSSIMITSPSVIYTIDPGSGYDQWEYTRAGCRIRAAVLGSDGALVSQTCTRPTCGQITMCGGGTQLFLRDGYAGRDDKNVKNPDRFRWNHIGDTDIPVSADTVISAVNTTTHELDLADVNGVATVSVRLTPAPTSFDTITATSVSGTELIWMGATVYAVNAGQRTPMWAAASPGSPTVAAGDGNDPPTLSTARITVPSATGLRTLDGFDGRTARSFAVPAPRRGSTVYPIGTGFLIASAGSTVVYR